MGDVQLVRLGKGARQLEVACVPGTVQKYRDGDLGLDAVLVAEDISNSFLLSLSLSLLMLSLSLSLSLLMLSLLMLSLSLLMLSLS